MASSSLLSSGDPLCLAGKATADSVRHPAQARLGGPDGQRAGWLAGWGRLAGGGTLRGGAAGRHGRCWRGVVSKQAVVSVSQALST